MGRAIIMGGGGGVFTDFVTAEASDILTPKIGADKEGEPVTGTMPNRGAVSVKLDTATTSYTVPAGYHNGSGKVNIETQTKSETPDVSAKTVTPDSGKVLSSVTVNAIPNQKTDSGNVTLTSASTTKSYDAGYYLSAHGATISPQSKEVTPDLPGFTVSPDSGKVLSSVKVNAIPNQKTDSGNVTLAVGTTSKSYPAGYYINSHGAQISTQTKEVTPGTSPTVVSPDSGNVLSSVTVNAIQNQKSDSGNTTLTASDNTKSYPAGYYLYAHGATVPVYDGSISYS